MPMFSGNESQLRSPNSYTMSTPKLTFVEEKDRILKAIQAIEANGGSAGYKSNPALFQEFAAQIYVCKSEDDLLAKNLEELKAANGLGDSAKKIEVLEARVRLHRDHRVRALLPKLQAVKANLQDVLAFESLIQDVRTLSEIRKGPKTGVNQRVLETIEGMESLGGSAGFKKYVAELPPPTERTAVVKPAEMAAEDDSWSSSWGNVYLVAAFIVAVVDVSASDVGASGVIWGLGIECADTWGWLYHRSPSVLDGTATTIKLESGALVTAQIACWFSRLSDDALMATFIGEGVGMGVDISITGSVSWYKK
ncbi:hypothetical protein BJ912DRAFT_1146926 [Pholiota molesta]|nr:hypothetical protein BJ912DRAFT_1146926 [Pholiota molesta]